MAKKRKCYHCNVDLTRKNYAQVFDRELHKVVIVCPRCANKICLKEMGAVKNG